MKAADQIRPCVFHVGLHKTGTTFLQRRIFPCLRNGARFLPAGKLTFGPSGWSFAHPGCADGSSSDRLLVSNESIAGSLFENDMDRLRALKDLCPNAAIILSVREQRSLLRSAYWQAVKEGWPHNYTRFQARLLETGKLDYPELRRGLEAEFGREGVLFVIFEELVSEPRTAFARIAAFAGCRSVPELGDIDPEKGSPTPMAVETQRLLNAAGLRRDSANGPLGSTTITGAAILANRCNRLWDRISRSPLRLFQSDADRSRITEHFAASNRRFFAQLYETPFSACYPGIEKATHQSDLSSPLQALEG